MTDSMNEPNVPETRPKVDWHPFSSLVLPGMSLFLLLLGSFMSANARGVSQDVFLLVGGPLLVSASIWLVTQIFRTTPEVFARPVKIEATPTTPDKPRLLDRARAKQIVRRIALLLIGLIWSGAAFRFCATDAVPPQPAFTNLGVFCWVCAIVTMSIALMDHTPDSGGWQRRQVTRLREVVSHTFSIRVTWTLAALVVILIVGAGYRLNDLSLYPPEMTYDLAEKAMDALRVSRGDRSIFFGNSTGREPFQMYYLAALQAVTRMPFSFELLKLGTGLEGMAMILLAWWLGRAIFGEADGKLGNLTGLIMAALVATSYWHTLLSRLGLRIVTTPLVAGLVLLFLARALRHNHRSDYIWAGVVLGVGIYCYQATRILPVLVVAGFILAMIIKVRSWELARRYVLNFAAVVLMALVVFVPMGRYMVQYPEHFWERTTTRMFGDPYRVDENGNTIFVSSNERLDIFQRNIPLLWTNFVNSLLMFNWFGDRSWVNGNPDRTPALDFFTGAFFILGVIAVLIRAFRRRDPVDALLPIAVCVMVLPSALALAFVIEVPGFTRASGALPMVYLLAAFGAAITVRYLARLLKPRWPRYAVYAVLFLCFAWGAHQNSDTYFVQSMTAYRLFSIPHHQAGRILRGFVEGSGAPGNAVMIGYKYWWDPRALAIESGDIDWPNVVAQRDPLTPHITKLLRSNTASPTYAIRTDRRLMFFLSKEDQEGMEALQSMFPTGRLIYITSNYKPHDFFLFVAPPVGCQWAKTQLAYDAPECKEK